MKNLSLILNAVLLLAVAYLFIDKFSAKEETPIVEEQPAEVQKPLKVVYINVDSLHAKSLSYQAISTSIEKKYKDAQANLRAKERAFQRDLEDYQKKIQSGTITPKQAQEIEGRLARQQEAFVKKQEQVSKELNDETTAFDTEFIGNLTAIVDSLKASHNYDFVLIDGGPVSSVLTANLEYDITNSVVELLNAREASQ